MRTCQKKKNLCSLREYLNNHKQTIGRNTNVKGASGEGSKENDKRFWKLEERESLLDDAENLTELYLTSYVKSGNCKQ